MDGYSQKKEKQADLEKLTCFEVFFTYAVVVFRLWILFLLLTGEPAADCLLETPNFFITLNIPSISKC